MKIGGNFPAFDLSANGLSVQRKKMNIIAENIANADTVRSDNGLPYQKKFLTVKRNNNLFPAPIDAEGKILRLNTSNNNHISTSSAVRTYNGSQENIKMEENVDKSQGDIVYSPDHPNADENGYVEISNVNIITEMVEMIAATRSYEANLTALNASKQIAKDSLEI